MRARQRQIETMPFGTLLAAVKFFFFLIGDIVGYRPGVSSAGTDVVVILGAVIFLVAIGAILLYGVRRDVDSGIPIGISLICFGLLFAVVVTFGRVFRWDRRSLVFSLHHLHLGDASGHLSVLLNYPGSKDSRSLRKWIP